MSVRERGFKKIPFFSLQVDTRRWSGRNPGCPRIRKWGFWVWKIPTPCRCAGKRCLCRSFPCSVCGHICVSSRWCGYRRSTMNAGLALLSLLLSRLAFGPGNWLIPKLYLRAPVYLLPSGPRGDLATGELSRWSWWKVGCWGGVLTRQLRLLCPALPAELENRARNELTSLLDPTGASCAVPEWSFIKAKIPG